MRQGEVIRLKEKFRSTAQKLAGKRFRVLEIHDMTILVQDENGNEYKMLKAMWEPVQ